MDTPSNPVRNLRTMILFSPSEGRRLIASAWKHAGLGEYGDAHWQATLAWFAQDEAKRPTDRW
jgi:hypothetical protein